MRVRLSSMLLGSMTRRFMSQCLNRKETTTLPWHLCQSHLLLSNVQKICKGNMFLCLNRSWAHFSSLSTVNQTENSVVLPKVEIISKEFIKPTTPTPQHSRTYEISLFDQLVPHLYMSFVSFFPNNDNQRGDDLILERRQSLKQSLSETLTKFYPLAGRLKDGRLIDCNDDGVYYAEAEVSNLSLSEFLKNPDNKSIHGLLPLDPNSEALLSRKDLAMIQVTIFGCGGISVGLYTSHRIMDFYSIATFLKSWSAAARASSEGINPKFILPSILAPNPALPQETCAVFFPLYSKNKNMTMRFLFRASSLEALKQKSGSSRVVAVTALIGKCAAAASRARSTATPTSSTLTHVVNLRDRTSSPSPPHIIGNFFTITPPIQCSENDGDIALDSIVQRLKYVTDLFSNHEFTEKSIENWSINTEALLNQLKLWYPDKNAKHVFVTSTCRSGIYEVDFGWGNPMWFCVGNGDSSSQFTENFVILMDTRCGKGIEAWVTLDEQDMMIFERDPELLAFASLNVSPLQLIE